MKKTKLKAFISCFVIILAVICIGVWAMASEPHGAVMEIYTDSGGGHYTLYADGHLYIEGYTGGEPEEGVLVLADRVKSMEFSDCVVTPDSGPLFKEFLYLTELSFTNTSFEGDMSRLFSGCTALESVDLSGSDMSGCTNMTQMFQRCTGLKNADLSYMEMSDDMNAYRIFENCPNIETVDMTGFNFGKSSLYAFFKDCPKLREVCLKEVDTSKVKAVNFMFNGCSALKSLDLSDFDTSNVTDYHDMFTGCTALEYLDVSGFDLTDTGNQMDSMFDGLVSLREINLSGFKTAGVTQMTYMFRNCKSLERLDLSGFDTSSVTSVGDMFKGCTSLKYLDVSNFDLSRVSNMAGLFQGLSNLEVINLSDFKVNADRSFGAFNLFDGCKSLKYLDLSNWDLSKANLYQAFNNVGFWELKLPETSPNAFPCFGGNTPIEKPYYTWDGDWSYYIGNNSEDIIRDDILQSSSDVTSPEQICLDTVRTENAGNAITIIANFTPIEYPITLHDKDTEKYVSYNIEKLPYTPPSEYTDKEYYSFDGFSLTEDLPVIKDFAVTLDGEYKIGEISDLYLNYTPIRYDINISFVDRNGKVITADVQQYSIEDTEVFSRLDKDYAEGMCQGYSFIGFTSEKLGISDAEEIPAPEAPCGSIDITAVMEETTEPTDTTEPSEAETSSFWEAASSEESTTLENSEIPSATGNHYKPEDMESTAVTLSPTETAIPAESETTPEESTSTEETVMPEDTKTPEDDTTSVTEDTTKPQESTVNTGDGSHAVAVIAGALIWLCLIACAVLKGCCYRRRKYERGHCDN